MVNLVTTWHDEEAMAALASCLRMHLGERVTTLVNHVTDRLNQVAIGDREYIVSGPGIIHEQLGPHTFGISAATFFQTHTRQAERLLAVVMRYAALRPADVVYDLYCGTGTISLFLAAHCAHTVGLELMQTAVSDAASNAAANNITNCTFQSLDLRDLTLAVERYRDLGPPRVVVTDPPRDGMHPKTVRALLDLAPDRLVYVSCKAASLARDLRALCQDGPYRVLEVQPVDMFPQTDHVETVALLIRNEPRPPP
jgi:23S rRNA (uracil1939-C5)-methyltransferase